jgi:hypothetical protein
MTEQDDEVDYEISDAPPRDDDGHPIHPERGHRICGAVKSERTTPTEHGRERDEYDYCLLAAGWGEDRDVGPCSKHPISGEQWGSSNPNYEDGTYSEFEDFMYDSLTDQEREALDALNLDEDGDDFAKSVVKEAYAKYLRSGDDSFLREARQWASEFGVIERPADELDINGDMEHSGGVDVSITHHRVTEEDTDE